MAEGTAPAAAGAASTAPATSKAASNGVAPSSGAKPDAKAGAAPEANAWTDEHGKQLESLLAIYPKNKVKVHGQEKVIKTVADLDQAFEGYRRVSGATKMVEESNKIRSEHERITATIERLKEGDLEAAYDIGGEKLIQSLAAAVRQAQQEQAALAELPESERKLREENEGLKRNEARRQQEAERAAQEAQQRKYAEETAALKTDALKRTHELIKAMNMPEEVVGSMAPFVKLAMQDVIRSGSKLADVDPATLLQHAQGLADTHFKNVVERLSPERAVDLLGEPLVRGLAKALLGKLRSNAEPRPDPKNAASSAEALRDGPKAAMARRLEVMGGRSGEGQEVVMPKSRPFAGLGNGRFR